MTKYYFIIILLTFSISQTLFSQNVGIGTDSVTSKLTVATTAGSPTIEIRKNSDADSSNLKFTGGQTQYQIGTPAGDRLRIWNDSIGEMMTITPNGDVGIGITDPLNKFHVNGIMRAGRLVIADTTRYALILKTDDNTADMGLAYRNNGGNFVWNIYRSDAGSNAAHLVIAGGPQQTNILNLPERMRITNTGNVGIGEISPQEKLHVAGSIRMVDGNQAAGYIPVSDANGTMIWTDPGTVATDTLSIIADVDRNTYVNVEQAPNEDVIRMSLAGLESFTIAKSDSGSTLMDIPNNDNNIFIGTDAGLNTTTGNRNVALGTSAQMGLSVGYGNVAIGHQALTGVDSGSQNTAIGLTAMRFASGSINTAVGASTLTSVSGGANVAVGNYALDDLGNGSDNVAVGRGALRLNTSGSGNVALGNAAGFNEMGSNTLYIANSDADSTQALVYGEFDNNWLRVNGHLTPTGGIADADDDTKIQVEESNDDDIIRFDLAGTEYFRMDSGRLEVVNTGNSVFIGEFAGASDDFSDNRNVGIGVRSLEKNIDGRWNSALGQNALNRNISGQQNVAIGFASAYNNETGNQNIAIGPYAQYNAIGDRTIAIGTWAGRYAGSGNVFVGDSVGYYEDGNNKLYIDNSPADSANALVYGEFDNNLLQINGTAKVNGIAYVTDKLGVGVANPNEKFEVYPNSFTDGIIGYSRIGTSNEDIDGIATFSHKDSGAPAIRQFSDGTTVLSGSTDKGVYFRVGADYFGSLQDGSSVSESLRGWNFDYPADASYYAVKMKNDNTSSGGDTDPFNGLSIQAGRDVNNGANSIMIGFYRPDGTEIGKIVQNNSSSVSYNTSSDLRLKTDIRPTHYSIDDLMKIDVRDYVYRDEPGDPQVGFVAQQLYQYYPLAVTPGGESAKTDPWMVDYGKITPLIVKAVQDQQMQIDAQKSMNESLQEQIDLLKKQNALLLQEVELLKKK